VARRSRQHTLDAAGRWPGTCPVGTQHRLKPVTEAASAARGIRRTSAPRRCGGLRSNAVGVLFVNGLLLDGLADWAVEGWVEVEGERIVALGRGQPGARFVGRTIDLAGRTIMPGLIDTHVHIAGGDYVPGYEHEAIGIAAVRTAEAARRTLLAGFTTVRTASSRDFLDLDVRDAIRMGLIPGPRIIGSGRGITCTGGHLREVAMEVDGPDEVRKAVRQHIKRGADSLKIMMSGGVATAGLPVQAEQFSVEEVMTAVYEAHKVGMKVLTHSIGLQAIRNAIEGGVDSIDHGQYLDEECAVRMKQRGIYLVPTFGRSTTTLKCARRRTGASIVPKRSKSSTSARIALHWRLGCRLPWARTVARRHAFRTGRMRSSSR